MKNQDEKLNALIKEKFSGSFLNDTKWRKLIKALVQNHELVKECQVKFVYDDKIRHLLIDGNEYEYFDYYQKAMESMVTHPITPGWTLYKEIQWINFPASTEEGNQDISKIKGIINAIGMYELEADSESLKVIAHR